MSTLFSHFFSKNNEIRPQEADFTEVLSTIAVMPRMLYFYGKMPKNRPKTVAIVGTRKPTKYGSEAAYELAFAAAKRGALVVSGLAYGIDSIAHRAALDAGGITVAVLGTPIDQIYPRSHEGLAQEIVEKDGIVMSELPRGAKYYAKTCFLQRNRLISGLADVVVIAEAAERSGSLNTAMHAIEQGRELFAVPGDITRPNSKGCNRLLAQGAAVYTEPKDVLDVLFPETKMPSKQKQLLFGDNLGETAILRAIANGERDGEKIALVAKMEPRIFNQNITILEIKGRVRALGANRWCLV